MQSFKEVTPRCETRLMWMIFHVQDKKFVFFVEDIRLIYCCTAFDFAPKGLYSVWVINKTEWIRNVVFFSEYIIAFAPCGH